MPITIKTVTSKTNYADYIVCESALNMAKALALAIGSEQKEIIDSSDANHKTYYVNMDAIGYVGWCTALEVVYDSANSIWRLYIYLCTTNDSDKTPNLSEANRIRYNISGTGFGNNIAYFPETCVMIYDEAKDTVLFDLHPGSTMNGTDLADNKRNRTSFTFFFARDVNDDVLCGVGSGHISMLRTLNAYKGYNDSVYYRNRTQRDDNNSDILHLTKMVNYLSPGYPEMKSAYVSVVRPLEKIKGKMYVSTLYANGLRWGRAGFIDSFNALPTTDYPGDICYFPVEPFVNY